MGAGNIPSSSGGVMVVSDPYVASYTPELSRGRNLLIDMLVTGDVAIQNPTNGEDGATFELRLRADGSSHNISFGTAYRGSSDTPLSSFSLSANSTIYRAFRWNAASGKADYLAKNEGFT